MAADTAGNTPPQGILDATELALWGTDFSPYTSGGPTGTLLDDFPNLIRLKRGYDAMAGCGVEVLEQMTAEELRPVLDRHHLAVVWDNGDCEEIDLKTGTLVTIEKVPEVDADARRQKVLQGLNAVMSLGI